MKDLYDMSKKELVKLVLSIDESETESHVKRQNIDTLILWIEKYRRYNPPVMTAEGKELYVYTKDHFVDELKIISPTPILPFCEVKRVVKMAAEQYIKDYCERGARVEDIFRHEDFQVVIQNIGEEIREKSLTK